MGENGYKKDGVIVHGEVLEELLNIELVVGGIGVIECINLVIEGEEKFSRCSRKSEG